MSTQAQLGASSDDSYDIWRIGAENLGLMWPQITPIIEEFGADTILNLCGIDELFESARGDKIDIWIGMENKRILQVGITQLCRGQNGNYLEVLWVGGPGALECLEPAIKKLEQYAAIQGCKRVVVGGRVGWMKVLAPLGFSFHRIEVAKELSFVADEANKPQWRN